MKQSPTVLHLLNCHTASLTMRQDSHSQSVSKVQATPRTGQNDRLPSDALTISLNGDSPFMFDLTQTMVLIKVLLLSLMVKNTFLQCWCAFAFIEKGCKFFYKNASFCNCRGLITQPCFNITPITDFTSTLPQNF